MSLLFGTPTIVVDTLAEDDVITVTVFPPESPMDRAVAAMRELRGAAEAL